MHIYGYLKKNLDTFEVTPFKSLDALAIAWMAYFDFDYVKDQLPLTIKEIGDIPYFKTQGPYIGSFVSQYSCKFMHALATSPRFQDAELLKYEYILDKESNAQFAVVAVRMAGIILIAFRGTDASYTGWREDFELAYKGRIVSYSLADTFVKDILNRYEENIILCGHSKGGNVATYLLSQFEDVSRIEHVYSFDGPGFRIQGLFLGREDRLKKITKIIPQSSLVGVLFSNETDVTIVKSKSITLMQHVPIYWYVKDNDFVYVKKRTLISRRLEKSINAWIEGLEAKEKERFTDIIFGGLDKLEAKDFVAFFRRLSKQFKPMYEAYLSLDMVDKKLLLKVYLKLIRNMIVPERNKAISQKKAIVKN